MDVYKLRNIVVSLQGGKHCFAKTRGCLLETGWRLSEGRRRLVGRQEDACRKAGGSLTVDGQMHV